MCAHSLDRARARGFRAMQFNVVVATNERARPGDRVIVQEKLDGPCVAAVREGGAITAYGREGRPCAASLNEGRRAFAAWVRDNADRLGFLDEGERLVCEWLLVAHGTRYALPHEPVVALDRFDAAGTRRTSIRPITCAAGPPAARSRPT